MTAESFRSCENPVISIQSDWDDVILSAEKEIWISSKIKGRNGIHSKIKGRTKNGIPFCVSQDFIVLSLGQTLIDVKFNPTGHVCSFVAPSKTFSQVHEKKIVSLDVTDEGLGVSACTDNKLVIWSAVTGEILAALQGHLSTVYRCRFFPSGLVVLSAGADMTLKIWSAETGDCPVTLVGHVGPINDFCVVDRGRNVISVSKDGTAKLWDCGKSACLATIFQAREVFNCCAIGELPELVTFADRRENVSDREIGTQNKLLVIGSEEGFIHGVSVFSRQKVFAINAGSAVNTLLIVSDKIVVGCQNGVVHVYEVSDVRSPVRTFDESNSAVLCGVRYKDRGFFVGRSDGSATYYDCVNFSNLMRISLTGPDVDPVYDISIANNSRIYTCCRDGKIRQYVIDEAMNAFYSHSNLM